MTNVLLKTRLCTYITVEIRPKISIPRSFVSVVPLARVVHAPETAENSLKERTNSLWVLAAISRYSVYVMAFTKVTKPCYCLGTLKPVLTG